jgi:hypothetical protein
VKAPRSGLKIPLLQAEVRGGIRLGDGVIDSSSPPLARWPSSDA